MSLLGDEVDFGSEELLCEEDSDLPDSLLEVLEEDEVSLIRGSRRDFDDEEVFFESWKRRAKLVANSVDL